MDTVGQNLSDVVSFLLERNIAYRIEYTKPTRDFFAVDETELYVVRQRETDGVLILTAAAKLRKEV